jgi:predicted nucleotidyltransferase component of viral defense system
MLAGVGLTAILPEKDIWVVWALRALFEDPVGAQLVFKGGASRWRTSPSLVASAASSQRNFGQTDC